LPQKPCKPEEGGVKYLKCWEEKKTKTKNKNKTTKTKPSNLEFCTLQNYLQKGLEETLLPIDLIRNVKKKKKFFKRE